MSHIYQNGPRTPQAVDWQSDLAMRGAHAMGWDFDDGGWPVKDEDDEEEDVEEAEEDDETVPLTKN